MNLPPPGAFLLIHSTWYTLVRDLAPRIDLARWDCRVDVLSRNPSPPGHREALKLDQKHESPFLFAS